LEATRILKATEHAAPPFLHHTSLHRIMFGSDFTQMIAFPEKASD